jgi:hypothetical protein
LDEQQEKKQTAARHGVYLSILRISCGTQAGASNKPLDALGCCPQAGKPGLWCYHSQHAVHSPTHTNPPRRGFSLHRSTVLVSSWPSNHATPPRPPSPPSGPLPRTTAGLRIGPAYRCLLCMSTSRRTCSSRGAALAIPMLPLCAPPVMP